MWSFIKTLSKRYGQDNITARSAALAYFAVFALGPLLFIILGILGLVMGSEVYRERFLNEVELMTGPGAAEALQKVADNQYLSDQAGIALLIGSGGLVLAGIGIFGQLQRSLNDILGVRVGPAVGWRAIVVQKFVSLSLVGLATLLLVASVIGSIIISALNETIDFGRYYFLITFADFTVSILVFMVLLAMVYRLLPDVKLPWKILFGASVIVAVLFALGTFVLSAVVSSNSTVSAFGTAGSVIALLLWVYYSGLIVYLGATGISVYANSRSVKMVPRYAGAEGVLRIRQTEEPLSLPIVKKAKKKLAKGIKKGWDK